MHVLLGFTFDMTKISSTNLPLKTNIKDYFNV